jgi:hypothetical protein
MVQLLEVTVNEDPMLTREHGIAQAEAALAASGISKPSAGWSEDALSRAIARQGWRYSCEGEPGNWRMKIVVRDDESGQCEVLSGAHDRVTALLIGFALALQDSRTTRNGLLTGRT